MKKIKSLVMCALIVAVSALSLCFLGCNKDDREQTSGVISGGYNICYVFTANDEVMQITEDTTLEDYMGALKTGNKLTYEGTTGQYGFFLTSVLGVSSVTISYTENSMAGYDWFVYTTVTTLDGTTYSSDSDKIEYNGITLYKASYGISSLPVIKDETYALVYQNYSMSW